MTRPRPSDVDIFIGKLPLSAFPERPATDAQGKKSPTRTIYVQGLPNFLTAELTRRGYMPTELTALPRHDTQTEKDYLLAKCRAFEEGTIQANMEDRRCLELAMRAAGMLRVSDSNTYDAPQTAQVLNDLLNWSTSRHTLRDNSTVQSAQPQNKKGDDQ